MSCATINSHTSYILVLPCSHDMPIHIGIPFSTQIKNTVNSLLLTKEVVQVMAVVVVEDLAFKRSFWLV